MNHHAYVRHNLINTGARTLQFCNYTQMPTASLSYLSTCTLLIGLFSSEYQLLPSKLSLDAGLVTVCVYLSLSRHDRWLKCTVGTAISYLLNCRQLSPDWIWERRFKVKWDAVFSARFTRICCRLRATLSQLGSHHFRYGSSALIRLFAHQKESSSVFLVCVYLSFVCSSIVNETSALI